MTTGELVHRSVTGRVARVTLDRPPLHILNIPMIQEFTRTLDQVEREKTVVCIIGATGEKAFSAGVDIRDHTPEKVPEMIKNFHGLIRKIMTLECVTIAAVRGVALGGGFEVALACDMIVAEEGATFGSPEIWLACFPPIAAVVLPRHISPQKARELVLSGEPITAAEAAQLGILNALAPRHELEQSLSRFIARFTEKSGAALRLAKRALRVSEESGFTGALGEIERLYLEDLMHTRDAREGVQAYIEKRNPKWEDR